MRPLHRRLCSPASYSSKASAISPCINSYIRELLKSSLTLPLSEQENIFLHGSAGDKWCAQKPLFWLGLCVAPGDTCV